MKNSTTAIFVGLISIVLFNSCKKKSTTPDAKITYQTDFIADDNNWYIGQNTNASATIANGLYDMTNIGNQTTWSFYSGSTFTNVSDNIGLEASVKIFRQDNSHNAYGGILWEIPPRESTSLAGKCFFINNEKTFDIISYDVNGYPSYLVPETVSPAIKPNDFNVLRIEIRAGKLYFIINGTEVSSLANVSTKLNRFGFNIDRFCNMQADYFKAFQL